MGMHNACRPLATGRLASSYSPITILKLRIRLRRLRNYCKVEAERKRERERQREREREREREGRADKTWPTFRIQADMPSTGGRSERPSRTHRWAFVLPPVHSFVVLLEFVLRGSTFFPRVHPGRSGRPGRAPVPSPVPSLTASPAVGAGQNVKHQPVMIHPSISPSLPRSSHGRRATRG